MYVYVLGKLEARYLEYCKSDDDLMSDLTLDWQAVCKVRGELIETSKAGDTIKNFDLVSQTAH